MSNIFNLAKTVVVSTCIASLCVGCSSTNQSSNPDDKLLKVNVTYLDPIDLNANNIPDDVEIWISNLDEDSSVKKSLRYYAQGVYTAIKSDNYEDLDTESIMYNIVDNAHDLMLYKGNSVGPKLLNKVVSMICDSEDKATKYLSFIKEFKPSTQTIASR